MQKKSNCFWMGITLLLLGSLSACSENPAPVQENTVEQALSEDAPHSARQLMAEDMPSLTYEKTILLLGGTPSLGAERQEGTLYSHKLQQRVGADYKMLNASVVGEPLESLKRRLPFLFKHDIKAVVLEVGYDEDRAGLNPNAFRQKLEAVLKYEAMSSIPTYLLLTTDNPKYRSVIEDLAELYNLELLIPKQPFADNPVWHDEVSELLESQVKIVR